MVCDKCAPPHPPTLPIKSHLSVLIYPEAWRWGGPPEGSPLSFTGKVTNRPSSPTVSVLQHSPPAPNTHTHTPAYAELLTPSFLGNHQSYHPSERDINSHQVHTPSSSVLELNAQAATANPHHFGHHGAASGKIAGSIQPCSSCKQNLPDLILLLLSALSLLLARVFQTGVPGEHSVSCGWTLCEYRNIIYIIYHSQCILFPLTKGVWICICIRGGREIFTY